MEEESNWKLSSSKIHHKNHYFISSPSRIIFTEFWIKSIQDSIRRSSPKSLVEIRGKFKLHFNATFLTAI